MKGSSRIGLSLLGLLSAVDVAGPILTDGEHPPMWVAWVGAGLGVASLALIVWAWRDGAAKALLPLVVLRLVSALSAVPAFFVSDVPVAAVLAAAVIIGVTVVGVVLVLPATRQRRLVGAR